VLRHAAASSRRLTRLRAVSAHLCEQ
jgi:hypothetical protein